VSDILYGMQVDGMKKWPAVADLGYD
jgi:hypothetical protein